MILVSLCAETIYILYIIYICTFEVYNIIVYRSIYEVYTREYIFTALAHLHLPAVWLVEKKTNTRTSKYIIAEEPTFHYIDDNKQGCPTSVRRANTLLSNETKIKLEMEQRASISRAYPRKTGINRKLISSFNTTTLHGVAHLFVLSCVLFSSAGDVPTVRTCSHHQYNKLVFLSFHISSTAQTRGPTDSWNHGRPSHSNTDPPTLNLPTRHPQRSIPCIPAQIRRDYKKRKKTKNELLRTDYYSQ